MDCWCPYWWILASLYIVISPHTIYDEGQEPAATIRRCVVIQLNHQLRPHVAGPHDSMHKG